MTAIGRIFFKNKTIIATDSLSEYNDNVKKHFNTQSFPKNPLSGHCGKVDFYPHLQCVATHTGSSMLSILLRLLIDRNRAITNIDDLTLLIEGPEFSELLKESNYVKSLSSENGFIGLLTLHGTSENIIVKNPNSNEFIKTKRDKSELIAKQYYVHKDIIKSMTLYDVWVHQESEYHVDLCCDSFTKEDDQQLIERYANRINSSSIKDNISVLTDFIKVCHKKRLDSDRNEVAVGGQVHITILENTDGTLSTTNYITYTFPDFQANLKEIQEIQDYENSVIDKK